MKSTIEFQKEEYERLLNLLELSEGSFAEQPDDENYFNAWNFGLREEDCNFRNSASICQTLNFSQQS